VIQAICYPGHASDFSTTAQIQTACISNTRNARLGLSEWSIAPNPSAGELNVGYQFAVSPNQLKLEVIDQFGKKVVQQNSNSQLANGMLRLNLAHLSAGVYYVRLMTDKGGSQARKWIKW
ncbi:MAG: T9SS type A sorting domain-containing protein, partial [Bacteroidota bacterium]